MKRKEFLGKRVLGTLLAAALSVSVFFSIPVSAATDPDKAFKDVPAGKWFTQAVSYCYLRGYVGGYSDQTFRPDNKLTRGEMAVIMSNVFEMPKPAANTFKDVKSGAWYTEAVLQCVSAGIMTGYSKDTFGVNDTLNREQGALILAKVFGVAPASGRTGFADDKSISSWAVESVKAMTQKKLLTGMGSNKFSPKTAMTRAQMCQILYAEAGKPEMDRVWKDAYMEWLKTSDKAKDVWSKMKYTLVYVDGDKIPELFGYSEETEGFRFILSYQLGTVCVLNLDDSAFVDVAVPEDGDNVWLAYYLDDEGLYNDQIWTVSEKDGWEKIVEGAYSESETERDEDGYLILENIEWDGKSVDEDTYFENLFGYVGEETEFLEPAMDANKLAETLK